MARLAVDAGRVVRVDRLLEDLWAPDAVATRRNTLQAKVTKLRRALEDPQLIVTTEDGYRLDIDPGDVDALVVLEEAATASRLRAEGDAEGALAASTTALGRFRGDVLQAAAGEWADVHKTRLDATRSALLETQLAARLELGGSGDLIGELEVAVAGSPYPGGPVGVAHHGAVPRRAPGRCARGVPTSARAARRRAGATTRSAASGA